VICNQSTKRTGRHREIKLLASMKLASTVAHSEKLARNKARGKMIALSVHDDVVKLFSTRFGYLHQMR
jgi:hypothetical protein